MQRALIVICDAENDPNYTRYVLGPEDMEAAPAAARCARIIEEVKAANPEAYEWRELVAPLEAAGFDSQVNDVVCPEQW